jgi:hypothetical protein
MSAGTGTGVHQRADAIRRAYDDLGSAAEIRRELRRQFAALLARGASRSGRMGVLSSLVDLSSIAFRAPICLFAGNDRRRAGRARERLCDALLGVAVAFAEAHHDWVTANGEAAAAGTPHRDDVAVLYRKRRQQPRDG